MRLRLASETNDPKADRLAAPLGFELLTRIRHWHDLIFCRLGHAPGIVIDTLFGGDAIDWK